MHRGIIIAEGYYEGTFEFETIGELDAFANGVGTGACLYGAGSCGFYTVDDLDEDPSDKIKELIEKHLVNDLKG